MLKKIVNSLHYRIIMFIIYGVLLLNIGIMFFLSKFGSDEPVKWLYIWLNILGAVILFTADVLVTSSTGTLIFVKKRDEEGFQAKRYSTISLTVSCVIACVYWISRTIYQIDLSIELTGTILMLIFMISATVFCIFFYMIILFLIGNKIVDAKKEIK